MEHTATTQNVPSALVHCGKARIYFSSSWRELEMWNRSEMNEKPKTKSRLKSQPRRKELRSTIITIRTPAHPFQENKHRKKPLKMPTDPTHNNNEHSTRRKITSPTKPWSLGSKTFKLSEPRLFIVCLSGCQFPSVCPYGVAFFHAENHRTVITKAREAVVKLRPRQFHRWHPHHTYKELELWNRESPIALLPTHVLPLEASALSLTDMRKEHITAVLARFRDLCHHTISGEEEHSGVFSNLL